MTGKHTTVELGGVERRLIFNMNALVEFETETGMALTEIDFSKKKVSMKTLRALLWVCLLTDCPTISIGEVGTWVDMDNLREVTEALFGCINRAMPKAKAHDLELVATARPI